MMTRTQKLTTLRRWLAKAFNVAVAIVGLFLLFIISTYILTPSAIRHPLVDHYHFRMQVVIDGAVQHFADSKYQTDYIKDSCSEELPASPIHFHDNKNQVVHIHWKGMTGGLVLKNYGWNLIGGPSDSLGYRFDNLLAVRQVPIHGKDFPDLSPRNNVYIYSGDEKSYKQRTIQEFTTQDLETFFNKASNLSSEKTSYIPFISDLLPATAYAHDGHQHSEKPSMEELSQINNLIGNVVIFAQKDRPTAEEVKQRFSHLEPLSDSTCGG